MKPASPSTPWYVVVEERKDAFSHPSPTGQEELELKACAGATKRRGLFLPSAAEYSECYEGRMLEEYKPSQNTQKRVRAGVGQKHNPPNLQLLSVSQTVFRILRAGSGIGYAHLAWFGLWIWEGSQIAFSHNSRDDVCSPERCKITDSQTVPSEVMWWIHPLTLQTRPWRLKRLSNSSHS